MVNSTLTTFGYPDRLIREYDHWCVLARPAQVTLGSLVLICKSEATQFADIPPEAHCELHKVTGDIERNLKQVVNWEKINYLMLMMVDPHVHFHVIARYGEPKTFAGTQFPDTGWPALPNLGDAIKPDTEADTALIAALREAFAA